MSPEGDGVTETTIPMDDPDVDLKVAEAVDGLRAALDEAGDVGHPVEVFLDPDRGVCVVRPTPAPPEPEP